MKRRNIVGVLAAAGLIAASLFAAGALVVQQTKVSPQAIASSVTRTPELMELRRHVAWQSNGSRCGPAAVANVNRSLGDAPNTEGKVLAGTGRCWTGVCILGLTLDELADVAQANTGRKVTVLRDLGEDEFREHLRRSNDPGRRYIVNFSRKRIFGAGVGHHSPIGGYLEPEDLVFVLDVNRDYQP